MPSPRALYVDDPVSGYPSRTEMKQLLKRAGATKIWWEEKFGWPNMLEVLLFTGISARKGGDALDPLFKRTGRLWSIISEVDWDAPNGAENPFPPDDFLTGDLRLVPLPHDVTGRKLTGDRVRDGKLMRDLGFKSTITVDQVDALIDALGEFEMGIEIIGGESLKTEQVRESLGFELSQWAAGGDKLQVVSSEAISGHPSSVEDIEAAIGLLRDLKADAKFPEAVTTKDQRDANRLADKLEVLI